MATAIDRLRELTPLQRKFLRCFEASSSVLQSARWAKISRQAHYNWMAESELYRDAFAASIKVAARTLEDEAVRRAHQGLRKAVWHKGRVVGYETEYSDRLMVELLRANAPEKFRTVRDNEPPGDSPVDITLIKAQIFAAVEGLPPEAKLKAARQLLISDTNGHSD